MIKAHRIDIPLHGRPEAVAMVGSRRWWALVAVATAQLMIASDATIMNIALPAVQRALRLSDPERQWVVTIFALCYGGLLLLGGRLSDLIGRRRCLLIGLAGFAAASVLGGAAVDPAMILTARALQGSCGALFTPAVLALIGTTFTAPGERGRAFGIYGTIMGSASGIGLILGGVLTNYAGWRWSLLVCVPVSLLAGVGALLTIPADRGSAATDGRRVPLDIRGAALVTAGLMALVFGLSSAQSGGWAGSSTLTELGWDFRQAQRRRSPCAPRTASSTPGTCPVPWGWTMLSTTLASLRRPAR